MMRAPPTGALLREDKRGAAALEFAIVAPVLCLFLVGAFDLAHSLYMRAVLEGIVQKTARDSTLETSAGGSTETTLDNKIRAQVTALANNSTITITRRFYRTFGDVAAARAETFTDTNHNGTCDPPSGSTPGEPYIDANNNNHWDADGGDDGQGGAKDRTLYTVNVSYPRMFPLNKFIPSVPAMESLTAKTVLENQPYSDQGSYTNTSTVRNCP